MISVIIRSKNAADTIGQVLKALFSQSETDFDVLVVDSGSKDETLEIVRQFPCKIKQIRPEDYFPGKVLNQAVAEVSGEMIVFLNSDTVMLHPHVLKELLNPFQNPEVVATFSRQLPRPDAEAWVIRDYLASFPDSLEPASWMYLSLPLAAMRRSVALKRPFYSLAWASEDTEWGYAAKKEGLLVKYVPKAIVMHSHNYTFKQLYGRRFVEGEADAFIFQRKYGMQNVVLDTVKATVRDVVFYIKRRDFFGIFKVPFLRFVYFWSYWKGIKLGNKRMHENNQNSSIGQKQVLKSLD